MPFPFTTAALDELPRQPDPCDPRLDWRAVRHHLGLGAFGVNAYLAAQPGDLVVEPHHELAADGGGPGHEELYVVVRGAARFTLDGADRDVAAVGFVAIHDPAVDREAAALAPGTVVLAVGAPRGEAFTASAWELSRVV